MFFVSFFCFWDSRYRYDSLSVYLVKEKQDIVPVWGRVPISMCIIGIGKGVYAF